MIMRGKCSMFKTISVNFGRSCKELNFIIWHTNFNVFIRVQSIRRVMHSQGQNLVVRVEDVKEFDYHCADQPQTKV